MVNLELQYAKELAGRMGWSFEFVRGYFDGIKYQDSDAVPPDDLLEATSQYGLGVQIGYRYGADYLFWYEEPQFCWKFSQTC